MFRKPFRIKSNNAIRGSERRKLKDHVSKSFPLLPSDEISLLVPNKENMSVMSVSTHNETTVTCYCLNKNPILFDIDGILLPTVYTLWKHPHMMISFKTSTNVFPILAGGADLMFPGILPPPCGYPDFPVKTACYVTLQGNGAAVAVGLTSCSRNELIQDGCAGKRVTIFHCFKDHLWATGEKDVIPTLPDMVWMDAPEDQDVSLNKNSAATDNRELHSDMETLALSSELETNCREDLKEEDVQIEGASEKIPNGNEENESNSANEELEGISNENEIQDEKDLVDEPVLTPQEQMDLLLRNCFYQALLDAKKVELPILVSKFSSQYLHAACPDGQRIDVKKSTYKKMSKFLSEMQSDGLIVVKELSKGVESIISMNVQNDIMMKYSSSEFAQNRKICKMERLEEEKEIKKKQSKTIEIRELYAVSAKVSPFFKLYGKSKGYPMSSAEVRQLVTGYVKDHELINQDNKKFINLDALLTDILFGKSDYQEKLTWDGIMSRMLSNMNSCHEITCPGEDPVVRKGKVELIEVTIENRMGNKKVTVVKNLEAFGIDTKSFAQSLQQAAASSTTVNPMPGKNSTGHLVIAQGIQTKHVKSLLETYKVPLKYAKGLQAKK